MMYRKLLLMVLIGLAALLLILLMSSDERMTAEVTYQITLPADSPDIYVTGMALTRYDKLGSKVMTVDADTVSVYNSSGQSLLSQPVVILTDAGQKTWHIRADQALVMANDDMEFRHNVVATQLNGTPATRVGSEFMRVSDQGQLISTDLAVTIVKGRQTVDAVGMAVQLDAPEPVINLLSEVNFVYEPS
ncbi:LPS export ABC transporter periplasmic protein LptC [Reinekea sp.]|uniref:LPS export ABC transporter periplasmic protein LptC n=1 Tax=Reinekea sp. TaxID=1970455 RepID=UPI002580F113|nr:LPS export ABC transporter periplasmic protein LptC [Reinekea sp.]